MGIINVRRLVMKNSEEMIKTMQEIAEQIKERAKEKTQNISEDKKNIIESVANRTINVMNEASKKLKEATIHISDEKELDAFLTRVECKCLDAKKFAFDKFEEIVPSIEADYIKIDEKENEVSFLDNENIKKVFNLIDDTKKNLLDFINKPENQKKYKEAKLLVLKTIDKGLDGLLKLLNK